ncbi:polysaccharide biosynthesis protein, partial [Litorivicinus sp.]|nr:polysaccharide biosynthesis protein [Litorivicinus sp.]
LSSNASTAKVSKKKFISLSLRNVRSDKDIYSVLRMFKTNIELPAKLAEHDQVGKLFCVSTDKAANPANLMGASKRLMEMRLCALHSRCDITFARFANVAFSDGSLLDGFCKRLSELQPLCFPNNIKRYFVSDRDAATICLLSSVLGQDRDIMFPVMDATLDSYDFRFLAESFLGHMGLTPRYCESEKEARAQMLKISRNWGKEWPCFAFHSDTDGEKGIEEFYTLAEKPNFDRFSKIGVLTLGFEAELDKLKYQHLMNNMNNLTLSISEIRSVVSELVPDYIPIITGRNLNDRM